MRACVNTHQQKHVVAAELASSLISQEKFSEADQLIEESFQIERYYEKALIQKARLFKMQGKFEQAENLLQQLIAQNPRSVAALNNLGSLLALQNQLANALSLFEKALLLNPKLGKTHKNIGLIHLKMGQHRQAMLHFVEAYKLMPSDITVLFEIGRLFDMKHNRYKAIDVYEKILTIDTSNLEAMMLLGIDCREVGQFEKAVHYFDQVWKQNCHYPEAFYRLARCKSDVADWNNWDETRQELIETLERDLASSETLNCSPMDIHY